MAEDLNNGQTMNLKTSSMLRSMHMPITTNGYNTVVTLPKQKIIKISASQPRAQNWSQHFGAHTYQIPKKSFNHLNLNPSQDFYPYNSIRCQLTL